MRGSRTRTCCRWSTPGSFRQPSASVRSRNSGRSCTTSWSCTRKWRCAPMDRSPGPCAKTRRRSRRSSTISSSSTAPARCSATSCCKRYLGNVRAAQESDERRGAREVSRHGAAFSHLCRPVRLRLAPCDCAGLSGIAARPFEAQRRGRRGRHADQAFHGGGSQRRHRQRGSPREQHSRKHQVHELPPRSLFRGSKASIRSTRACSRSPLTTRGPHASRRCGRRPPPWASTRTSGSATSRSLRHA